jgi:hypothetical protein
MYTSEPLGSLTEMIVPFNRYAALAFALFGHKKTASRAVGCGAPKGSGVKQKGRWLGGLFEWVAAA